MSDKLTFLKNNGIDIDAGLSYLGDEAMYNEILLDSGFKSVFISL